MSLHLNIHHQIFLHHCWYPAMLIFLLNQQSGPSWCLFNECTAWRTVSQVGCLLHTAHRSLLGVNWWLLAWAYFSEVSGCSLMLLLTIHAKLRITWMFDAHDAVLNRVLHAALKNKSGKDTEEIVYSVRYTPLRGTLGRSHRWQVGRLCSKISTFKSPNSP